MRGKRGISIIIGYLLLVSFAIILSSFIYIGLKTYIPTQELKCPEGVSLYLKEATCTGSPGDYDLDITLKNNGRFDIAGYYIYVANDLDQEIAVKSIGENLTGTNGTKFGSSVLFDNTGNLNSFDINEESGIHHFDLDEEIYMLTIIPSRFEEIEGKSKYLICNGGKLTEIIDCS